MTYMCKAESDSEFVCTRSLNHDGPHIASDNPQDEPLAVYDVWAAPDPEPDGPLELIHPYHPNVDFGVITKEDDGLWHAAWSPNLHGTYIAAVAKLDDWVAAGWTLVPVEEEGAEDATDRS